MRWNSTFPTPSTKQKPPSVLMACPLRPQSIIEQYTKSITHHIDAYGRDIGYYAFGDIGNRETGAQRNEQTRQRCSGDIEQLRFSVEKRVREACAPKRQGKTYTSNALNQYTQINEGVVLSNSQPLTPNNSVESTAFVPSYDANGNQTVVQTTTGTWMVTYNAENRPITWTKGDAVITMEYDYMGRRISYQKMQGDTLVSHTKFLYNGFLCVQELSANAPWNVLKEFVWDPTESISTRPLVFTEGEQTAFYMHDGNKNVTDVISSMSGSSDVIHYDYAPFGAVTRTATADISTSNSSPITHNSAQSAANPFRFSSEYHDDDLGLVYYNYRHYNPTDGRWINRDSIEEKGGLNLYRFVSNNWQMNDLLGLSELELIKCNENTVGSILILDFSLTLFSTLENPLEVKVDPDKYPMISFEVGGETANKIANFFASIPLLKGYKSFIQNIPNLAYTGEFLLLSPGRTINGWEILIGFSCCVCDGYGYRWKSNDVRSERNHTTEINRLPTPSSSDSLEHGLGFFVIGDGKSMGRLYKEIIYKVEDLKTLIMETCKK